MSFKRAFEPPCNYCGEDHSVEECPRVGIKQAVTVLEKNIRAAISKAKRSGTTGMSYANLKQLTSTAGLSCTVADYHLAFDKAVEKFPKEWHYGKEEDDAFRD